MFRTTEHLPKSWTYWWIDGKECSISLAVIHLGWAGKAFIHVSQAGSETPLFQKSWFTLPKWGVSVRAQSQPPIYAGFTAPGILAEIQQERAHVPMRLLWECSDLEMHAEFEMRDAPEGLSIESFLEGNPKLGPIHTQKKICIPTAGEVMVRLPEGKRRLSLNGAWAGCDWTSGHLPRRTRWQWSFAARGLAQSKSGEQRTVAWNLCRGNNLGGALENALWVEGHKVMLPSVQFQKTTPEIAGPYRIWSDDDSLELSFTPRCKHQESLNLGLIGSSFTQMMGTYSGVVRTPQGELRLSATQGVLENQNSLW